MARPIKAALPYFSHDVNARADRKHKLFIRYTGLVGYGCYWALLEDIYNKGYYTEWTEADQEVFVAEFHTSFDEISFSDISYVIEQAVKWDLFDKDIYKSKNILTSAAIQRRWLKASARRVLAKIRSDLLLLDIHEFYEEELKNDPLSVKIVSPDGTTEVLLGDYSEPDRRNGKQSKDDPPEPKYDTKYDFDSTHRWDGEQPIDYAGCVETWNNINGARSRITDSKRVDLRRVFRNYIGKECLDAMIVRAEDENMKDSKYKTDWSTLFGAKKLENLDKWVGRGREWADRQQTLETPADHMDNGWLSQSDYKKICDRAGVPFDDPMFCETKKVDNMILYYPKFDY